MVKSLNMSSSVNIDLFFMFLPPFDSSQWDESNELKIVKNGSVVFDIAIIYFLLSLGYLDHFLTSSISTISTISTLFRPYFDPEFSISVSCIALILKHQLGAPIGGTLFALFLLALFCLKIDSFFCNNWTVGFT